jgi:hypothetical protein
MTKKILSVLLLSLYILTGRAQTSTAPTWYSDVACIIYSHCTTCHNPGSIAPTSFLTYSEARVNSQGIKSYVSQGLMPPYLPNTTYQHYTDMRTLTTQEVNTLIAWVDSGAQQGDTAQAMSIPTYTNTAYLTHPDLTGIIPTFMVPSTGADVFQCFVLTGPQDSTKYIKTIEVIPGNRNAVHHVLIFEDTSYYSVRADSLYPGPGYPDFGSTGSSTANLIGAWVPGSGIDSVPGGMGIKFTKGSRIVVQIHYPVTSAGLTDSTRVNIQFTPTNSVRNVTVASVLNYVHNMTDGPINIPIDSTRTYHEKFTVPANVTILSIAPHAHLVCTQMNSFAVTPVGDTIPLIDIDRWDFHWQGAHSFQKPIKIPAGSTLYGEAKYINSYDNPEVPLPLRVVTSGEETTDEMMLFFFWYLPYQAGDENIIVDTVSSKPTYMNCVSAWVPDTSTTSTTGIKPIASSNNIAVFPNPTQNILNYQSRVNVTDITITDIAGRTVKQISATGYSGQIPVSDLTDGLYFLKIQTENGTTQTIRFTKD